MQPHPMALVGPGRAQNPGRRSGRRGQAVLAPLPDLAVEEAAALVGEQRARAVLAAAAAAGHPLVTPTGHPRSLITLPEYRRGRAPRNKGRRYPPEPLAATEVLAILDALPGGPSGIRDRALIVLLWRGGLRIAEVLALYPKDVDLELRIVTVLDGKGAKRRVVVIDNGAVTHLRLWLDKRETLGLGDDVPLICTVREAGHRGRPLASSAARQMLKHYARKAGVTKRVHPHGLRHTHAFELANEDVPTHMIQAQLGHESLDMTQRYIDHLTPKDRQRRIAVRVWPGDTQHAQPMTQAALSQGAPVPVTAPEPPVNLDPPEPPAMKIQKPAPAGQGAERVWTAIAANGGEVTQGQLRRALGLRHSTLLTHLHRLHEQRRIVRAGLDRNRSVIWKIAPPPVRMRRVTDRAHRRAPNGDGVTRVLDALEALDGRASQAQLARALGLAATTVHGYCLELEEEKLVERGGLDKTTSHRGSQIWRLRDSLVSWTTAGSSQIRITLRP